MEPDNRAGPRAALAAMVLAVVLCCGLLAHLLVRHHATLRPELVSKLAAVGRLVADQVGLTLDVGVPFDAIRGMDDYLAAMAGPNPEIAYVAVAETDGTVLYRHGAAPARVAAAVSAQLETSGGGLLDVAVPLWVDGTVRGSVHVGLGEGELTAWRSVALAGLVALAAGGLSGGLVLAAARRRIDRPLVRLTAMLAAPSAPHGVAHGRERGEMLALALAVDGLCGGLAAHRADALLELEEIALAQPELEGRRAVRAIAERVAP